jgi:hypothetical protein
MCCAPRHPKTDQGHLLLDVTLEMKKLCRRIGLLPRRSRHVARLEESGVILGDGYARWKGKAASAATVLSVCPTPTRRQSVQTQIFGDGTCAAEKPWPPGLSPSTNPNSPMRRHGLPEGSTSDCRIAIYSGCLDVAAGCCILGSPLGKLRCRAARGQVPARRAADAGRSLAPWHTSLFCAAMVCGAEECRRRSRKTWCE